MTHRFFIPTNCIAGSTVNLPGETARQIRTVLRMQPGDEIIVLDNSGMEWRIELTRIDKGQVQGQVMAQQPALGEPGIHLTLYQGTLKSQRFEWALQKGTELGVSGFVPTICRRSVVRQPEALAKKQSRWQQIIREAAEQSGRGKLPQLQPAMPLAEALTQAQSTGLIIMPWEEATEFSLKDILTNTSAERIALFIGPEGGFTQDEAALARTAGAHLVKLGSRILRAETAGLAACAAIFYQLGEWA